MTNDWRLLTGKPRIPVFALLAASRWSPFQQLTIASSMSSDAATPLLSVIVPCYNERATVAELLRRVHDVPIEKEIIVVDDASTDGSRDIVAKLTTQWPEIRHVIQSPNQGKGAAIRRGIELARGEVIIIQDADL